MPPQDVTQVVYFLPDCHRFQNVRKHILSFCPITYNVNFDFLVNVETVRFLSIELFFLSL